MEAFISHYLELLIDAFFNLQKRVYIGYLIAAFIIALLVQTFVNKNSILSSFLIIFSKKIWLSNSARYDYIILIVNQVIMMGWLGRLIPKLAVTTFIFEYLHIFFNGRVSLWVNIPSWMIAVLFTLLLFLFDDLARYIVHRCLHRWSTLWAFHKVHHSAETLTPFTVYRTHPVEGIIFSLRTIIVQAIVVAGFIFFFGERAELVTVLGANVILFLFNTCGANLRHSHIWISYGTIIEHILISPAQHQIHHSKAVIHHDKNFGTILSIWDWIGGSLSLAKKNEDIKFGLGKNSGTYNSLRTIYLKPCFESIYCLSNSLKKAYIKMSNSISVIRLPISIVAFLVCTFFGFVTIAETATKSKELNIYSHRQPFLIKPFIDAYSAQTGIKVNIVYASKGLAQRLEAEGERSPADLVLTVDMARLNVYADKNLLHPVESSILKANIPKHLRDPDNHWFAFSKRARVIVVAKRAKDAQLIKNYEDLVNQKWNGRLCARPGSHVYNRALIASFINKNGVSVAEAWSHGIVKNLARRPQGNDRAQVKAIYEGVCDIAIINNYYFGKLKFSEKLIQRKWANSVNLIFPNQSNRGTHINISGGGVVKHSKNKAEAIRFLEFLTQEKAQNLYGSINFEYPVNSKIPIPKELMSWGAFKEDKMPIIRIADLAPDAQKVIDRVGW
jgi:iron(III) transport system substrate-binding protein